MSITVLLETLFFFHLFSEASVIIFVNLIDKWNDDCCQVITAMIGSDGVHLLGTEAHQLVMRTIT